MNKLLHVTHNSFSAQVQLTLEVLTKYFKSHSCRNFENILGRKDCLQCEGWGAPWRLGGEGTEHPCLDGELCGESLAKRSACLNMNCSKFFLLICFHQAVIRGCYQGVIPATPSLPQG